MNQMLKRVSSVCMAMVCSASLMVSGSTFVMAGSEIDDTLKSQITTTAEGLTDAIIPLTDDQIDMYLESGDEFTENAMTAWTDVRDEVGDLKEAGEAEVEYSNDQYTATVPVEFENLDTEFIYVFEYDDALTPVSMSVNVHYPLSVTLKNAALNTLMGLGTVFVVLALLIFLISLFKFIPGSPAARKEKKKEPVKPAAASAPVPVAAPAVSAPATDDKELIAVIAAAIAASEGTSPDGFVVRSIRKINRKKR